MKKALIFPVFFLIISMSLVSANFACGYLENADDLSSVWQEVLVYYQEDISSKISCKVSSENKYCCDLEKINEVRWSPGKVVFAEVLNQEQGYVAGPVSGLTTEESYFVLPEMKLEKAINFNQPIQKVLINKSEVFVNLSLIESYNNLKYFFENSPEILVCESCTNAEFFLPLNKGLNEITLIAYNSQGKEVYENLEIFSLDYLIIKDSFECEKCTKRGNNFYVPSDSEINLNLEIFSSHEISEQVNVLIPIDWDIPEEYFPEDYTLSHNLVKWNLSESPKSFTLTSSKTTFKRKDYFLYEIGEFSKKTKVNVYSFLRFFPFASNKKPTHENYFRNLIKNKCSPTEPLILNFSQEPFDLIAIYPTKEYSGSKASLIVKENKFLRRKEISFNLLTNIPSKDIQTILLRFKLPKNQEIELFDSSGKINIENYYEDSNFNYYEAYSSKKGIFKIKYL